MERCLVNYRARKALLLASVKLKLKAIARRECEAFEKIAARFDCL